MKRIFILFAAVAALSMVSCVKEDHAVNQKVEYYASYDMIGGTPYILPIGTPWVDPGVVATANGEDVSSQLVIVDEVDDETIGAYNVNYSYTNPDGFANSVDRTVYVCNPAVTTDISGTWTSIDGTYRLGGEIKTPYPGFQCKIKKICPGFFQIDDMMAQYYNEYVGYGPKYNYAYDFSAEGNLSLNPDNSIDLVGGGYVGAWGDYAGPLYYAKYDPSSDTISYVVVYAGMYFYVVLKRD